MSAAGTPSSDPWVIVGRERSRYEDQFRSLKPIDGMITGEQAKGFLLQSQLPPLILGQIWALADTNADGKMDINEFSIACKLINLKLRGFDIPKMLPPTLIASLRMHTNPPAIPPLPTNIPPPSASIPLVPPPPQTNIAPLPTAISSPQPIIPALPTNITQQTLINQQPLMTQQPLIPNLNNSLINQAPIVSTGIPTGIVPPMQSGLPSTQSFIPPISASQPLVSFGPPLIPGVLPGPTVSPATPLSVASLISTAPVPLVTGSTIASLTGGNILPPVTSVTPIVAPIIPSGSIPSLPGSVHSTPRASISSIDRVASVESPLVDWSVPHQTKLKYTQIFNTTDRTRSGYLSGVQARNVMVQTKLPQNILAQIWALSDMDSDGRLGSEEFVLAMHLCEQALQGVQPPTMLPLDLIPPSFRRGTRTNSISSQGSVQIEQDPASTLPTTTFEDKRKENFEKGQAELDRRRKMLLDQQRKEAEERERKEREEIERRERTRQEAERRRMEELEKQMREQQEQERLKEEERKRQADQREAARREMERQRQLEWEKQRSQELQQQRQREQETVLKLKAKNQSLSIELSSFNENIKELSQKICDTRVGVSNVKTTIDGMRSTRDSQMQEMSQLKNKLKEQNAKLLALTQEKVKLDAKNKLNQQPNEQCEQKQAFDNKEISIKNLKEKVEDLNMQIDGKMNDIENNNSQLTDLRSQLTCLLTDCESLYKAYEGKRDKVLEMKNATKTIDYNSAWKNDADWDTAPTNDAWPVDDWGSSKPTETKETILAVATKYKALYEFVARNTDEISFQPGDIINVPIEQTGEPGWLAGEIKGHTGWFPESYVEPLDGIGVGGRTVTLTEDVEPIVEEIESKRLEGIAEIPETIPEAMEPIPEATEPAPVFSDEPIEFCIASYPYQSVEQGDLSFNAGDIITVVKKEGDWWTGKIDLNTGIFPCNYVQKYDPAAVINGQPTMMVSSEQKVSATTPPAAVITPTDGNASQFDNEVSQITDSKAEKSPDYPSSNTQTLKSNKKPEIASVIAPYQASSPEQLSLQRGQLIMIRKKTDSGWWEGELQAKGRKRQVGWFPASYVKILNSSGRTSGRTTPVSTTRIQQEVVIDKVVALYPYTAANPDELSFLKDDIISVTAREEPSWWRGELNGVSGLFPSNYVAPLQQSLDDPQDKMRQECINELIQTEKTYIDDMTTVHEVFEIPLIQSKIISKDEIQGIFVNWQDILQCNRNFLQDLNNRLNSGSTIIGDVICSHLPLMTSYIIFCSKQLESAALLQRLTENSLAFRKVVRQCQSNRVTRGMPLSSFLIKPMQRITRYPLLIGKILEHTSPLSPDHHFLEQALHLADGFLKRLNENVRLKENEDRLEWLQNNLLLNDVTIRFRSDTNKLGPRKLIHYGVLTKVKSGKELVGFLFNDFFMLIQPSKAIGASQFNFQRNSNIVYKIYKQPILVKDLKAAKVSTDNMESGTDANRVLRVQDKKQTISLLTSSANDCSLWLKRIDDAKSKYLKVISFSRFRQKSIHSSSGAWLFITLIDGQDIYSKNADKNNKRKGKLHMDNIYCKVSVDDQEQITDTATDNIINGNVMQNGAPPIPMLVWNYSMQFLLGNINEEVLQIVVYEMCEYEPDEFLGRADLKIIDLYREAQHTNGPITKKLILHQVESGELTIKLDLQMFTNY
ncbi:hypothetical protein FQA39_LY05500 [Lamprigera yunnana]|nr:hypothetical protein FQA39_LY05500 [Lamprigera yunnana]